MTSTIGEVDVSLDRFARLTRRTLKVPTATVTVVNETTQRFPGASGLPAPYDKTRETPIDMSFCRYVVAEKKPLIVEDARLDERLKNNRAVSGLNVIAYAGFPLMDRRGEVIGSVCAIDSAPRSWSRSELDTLQDLALACSSEVAAREGRLRALEVARIGLVVSVVAILLVIAAMLGVTPTATYVAASIALVGIGVGFHSLRM